MATVPVTQCGLLSGLAFKMPETITIYLLHGCSGIFNATIDVRQHLFRGPNRKYLCHWLIDTVKIKFSFYRVRYLITLIKNTEWSNFIISIQTTHYEEPYAYLHDHHFMQYASNVWSGSALFSIL